MLPDCVGKEKNMPQAVSGDEADRDEGISATGRSLSEGSRICPGNAGLCAVFIIKCRKLVINTGQYMSEQEKEGLLEWQKDNEI